MRIGQEGAESAKPASKRHPSSRSEGLTDPPANELICRPTRLFADGRSGLPPHRTSRRYPASLSPAMNHRLQLADGTGCRRRPVDEPKPVAGTADTKQPTAAEPAADSGRFPWRRPPTVAQLTFEIDINAPTLREQDQDGVQRDP